MVDKRVLKLIVFRLLLLLDGPELHADTDQPAIKQIKYNTHRQTQRREVGGWDSQLQPFKAELRPSMPDVSVRALFRLKAAVCTYIHSHVLG